jgi:hypothetical protein
LRAERRSRRGPELAEPALREALSAGRELEARRAIEALLKNLGSDKPSAEEVRAARAMEALGRAGTPGARRALEALRRATKAE